MSRKKKNHPEKTWPTQSARAELAVITVAKQACDWATEVTWTVSYTACRKAEVIKMATERKVPELGGYNYEFTSNVPEYYECLVCQLTLKDPVQIVGCGHRLCNICMESLLRSV